MGSGGATERRSKATRVACKAALAGALVARGGCLPAPSILSLHEPTPTDPGPPTDAAFTISGGGRISCQFPLGCDALAWFEPIAADAAPALTITPTRQITFFSMPTSVPGTWDVSLLPMGAPTRLPPGRYKVAGVVNTISDTLRS